MNEHQAPHSGTPSEKVVVSDLAAPSVQESTSSMEEKPAGQRGPEVPGGPAGPGGPGGGPPHEYPGTFTLIAIMIALYLAIFLVALVSIMSASQNTQTEGMYADIVCQLAGPHHHRSDHSPHRRRLFDALSDIVWYGSAYLLTSCSFQMTFGRVYTFYSPKWVFLTAVVIFEVGSALCGAASNSTAFILGRAIAGLGSFGIFSGAIVILTDSLPLQKRPMVTGLLGSVFINVRHVRHRRTKIAHGDCGWQWKICVWCCVKRESGNIGSRNCWNTAHETARLTPSAAETESADVPIPSREPAKL